jgi:hypothetical protein
VAASALGHKLAPLLKWLSQLDFGTNHDCLLLGSINKAHE